MISQAAVCRDRAKAFAFVQDRDAAGRQVQSAFRLLGIERRSDEDAIARRSGPHGQINPGQV
jgi:hypothetical protein